MDKALVFGTKDCRFESCQGHYLAAVVFVVARPLDVVGVVDFSCVCMDQAVFVIVIVAAVLHDSTCSCGLMDKAPPT